ncbi:hypothetical protein Dimus_027740 [Dionaea muscipula]
MSFGIDLQHCHCCDFFFKFTFRTSATRSSMDSAEDDAPASPDSTGTGKYSHRIYNRSRYYSPILIYESASPDLFAHCMDSMELTSKNKKKIPYELISRSLFSRFYPLYSTQMYNLLICVGGHSARFEWNFEIKLF